MKKLFLILLLLASTTYSQNFDVEFFPTKKKFFTKLADGLAPQMSLHNHLESREWFGNIGGNIPVFNLDLLDYTVQASAGATVFNTIIKTPGHIQVYTIDYLVDFYFDTRLTNELSFRVMFGHLSAHYADDGIVELNNYPISYVRDYLGSYLQYEIPVFDANVYGGIIYNYHNEPQEDKKTTWQFGGDIGYPVLNKARVYVAVDIKIKSEVNNGTIQSYQAGIAFPTDKRFQLRFAYTHRRGFEERGQIYNQKDIKNTLGFYLDF